MSGTYTNILVHIIFSTKNRAPVLTETYRERLYSYMGGILRSEGHVLLKIGGTNNHMHIAVKIKAKTALADIVRKLKANSSKWVNENKFIIGQFAWQNGYGAFSVSKSQINKVIDYIHNQEEHHKKQDFKEELILLLKKHEIDYNEKYLLD